MRSPAPRARLATFGPAAVAVLLLVSLLYFEGVGSGQTGGAPPAQDPQRPVFRTAANLVTVDAYPRKKDGRILEGLAAPDFEVREDGVLQKVDQFEFVRVEPVPSSARVDPTNQNDMLREAADPHNRMFVIYLDIPHVDMFGGHYARQPLMEFVSKAIGPNDMFAVMTWKVPLMALTFQRTTYSLQQQLTKFWAWGAENRVGNDPDDPYEDFLDACCQCDAQALKVRRRETRALQNLQDLIMYLGAIREARTTLILVSGGWVQFGAGRGGGAGVPQVTNRGGRLGINEPGDPWSGTSSACQKAQTEILGHDNARYYRDLVNLAVRSNVVFYPIDPGGLRAPMGGIPNDAGTRRLDSLITLAHNTDGIPIVNTNDLVAGANRIINDTSAYYLLGYYSTNSKRDGGLRRISVKVKEPAGVTVVARRSYVAENAAKVARAEAEFRANASPGAPPEVADAVKTATGPLARLDTPATEMFVSAVRHKSEVLVVAEVATGLMAQAGSAWNRGVAIEATAVTDAGEKIGSVTGAIAAGARSVLLRMPVTAASGSARVTITSTGQGATATDQVVIPAGASEMVGAALAWRGTPSAQSALTPVADLLFRRTERAHLEWPIGGPLDRREARLLDRRGMPLPIPVMLTERDATAGPSIVADMNLAPLSPGDYVLELTVVRGAETAKRYVALRIAR